VFELAERCAWQSITQLKLEGSARVIQENKKKAVVNFDMARAFRIGL
jgi:hypothetical protein